MQTEASLECLNSSEKEDPCIAKKHHRTKHPVERSRPKPEGNNLEPVQDVPMNQTQKRQETASESQRVGMIMQRSSEAMREEN